MPKMRKEDTYWPLGIRVKMQQKRLLINNVQKYTQIMCTMNKLIKHH